ncbi:thiazole-phosphate synthase [Propionispira arboris]|uniref:Thiazole synthase n=1 Tax=Propionispira arboris TaxID=84035 RepID=A0A1H7AJJ9_9FIRM|nr:thiazole synthase [Propionispira arboris]SEJ62080.1 thiazole-phosphate synthase [Propionispira arboris]
MEDLFTIGNTQLQSRLLIGTGKFSSNKDMPGAIEAAAAKIVTVALRRADSAYEAENILNYIPKTCILMPNTSGARTAEEAVRIAHMARAMGCGDWIKIEVISDNRYLLPDNQETIKATEILANEGFIVLPYMSPDLMSAKRLVDAGAAAVMPLGAPIGSNRGLQTIELLRILIDEIDLPIIVDAGIGRPSEAAAAMEMGAAGVLVNTAIATATDPATMAHAFNLAVQAGRSAYLAGLGRVMPSGAAASSPLTGFLRDGEVL